jgi:hypothetical protein
MGGVYCHEHPEKPVEFYCFMHSLLLCNLCVWDHAEHKNSVKVCVEKDILKYVTALKKELEIMSSQIYDDMDRAEQMLYKIEFKDE